MDVEAETRVEIARRIDRLRETFGDFEVHEETVENDPDFFEEGKQLVEGGFIGDAGAWVTDANDEQVLLIRHEGSPDRWGTPGGSHEPGERMTETARREVREETGIDCTLTDVLYARRKTVVLDEDHSQRYHLLTLIFDATADGGDLSISDDEILEAKWFAKPPDTLSRFIREQVSPWTVES